MNSVFALAWGNKRAKIPYIIIDHSVSPPYSRNQLGKEYVLLDNSPAAITTPTKPASSQRFLLFCFLRKASYTKIECSHSICEYTELRYTAVPPV